MLRPNGTSDFNLLQERAKRRKWYPGTPVVTYCVFDLLVRAGELTINLPLTHRKQMLQEMVVGIPRHPVRQGSGRRCQRVPGHGGSRLGHRGGGRQEARQPLLAGRPEGRLEEDQVAGRA